MLQFGVIYYQFGECKYTKVDMKGLENLSALHEEGELVITTITVFSLGGLVLSYDNFWNYYEDFVG